jgi:hypothetical protein
MIAMIIARRLSTYPRLSSTVPEDVLIEIGEYWRIGRADTVAVDPAPPALHSA